MVLPRETPPNRVGFRLSAVALAGRNFLYFDDLRHNAVCFGS
jgi:hypothetical protein